jgi:hypothetical protein
MPFIEASLHMLVRSSPLYPSVRRAISSIATLAATWYRNVIEISQQEAYHTSQHLLGKYKPTSSMKEPASLILLSAQTLEVLVN